jgi:tetratricopeptide (TPR) repeat protein/prophage maintenance system killer protein
MPPVADSRDAPPTAHGRESEATGFTPGRERMSESHGLALAHFAEAIGEGGIAADLYTAVLSREGGQLPALLGLGRVLHPLGRTAEGAAALERAVALRPQSVEGWCNLSALRVEQGRADEALAAAARALELHPDLGAAELNRGDALRQLGRFSDAAAAYERAVALRPRWPAALNKLAGVLRILRNYDRAADLLGEAIAIAPRFGLARVNLGTLRIEQGLLAAGRTLLIDALEAPGLDATSRAEAESALAMAAEHERLAPAIASALDANDPEPLRKALHAERDPAWAPCGAALDLIARMTRRIREAGANTPVVSGSAAIPPEWPGIEAHFAFHRPESPDDIRATLIGLAARRTAADVAETAPAVLDVVHFERAVRQRRSLAPGAGTGSEAWLRYWHARLTAHRPEVFPGQIKPVPNFVMTSHQVARAAPRQAAASCAEFFATQYNDLAPGFARATLVYFAISQIHPFFDGNGRVARFLLNAELELAGLSPLVITQSIAGAIPKILRQSRATADLGPLMDAIAEAAQITAGILVSLAGSSGVAHGR